MPDPDHSPCHPPPPSCLQAVRQTPSARRSGGGSRRRASSTTTCGNSWHGGWAAIECRVTLCEGAVSCLARGACRCLRANAGPGGRPGGILSCSRRCTPWPGAVASAACPAYLPYPPATHLPYPTACRARELLEESEGSEDLAAAERQLPNGEQREQQQEQPATGATEAARESNGLSGAYSEGGQDADVESEQEGAAAAAGVRQGAPAGLPGGLPGAGMSDM